MPTSKLNTILISHPPLILALLLSAAVTCFLVGVAYAAPEEGETLPQSLPGLEAWMTGTYLPKRLQQAEELKQELTQQATEWAPPPGQEITARFDNFHGAELGDYAQAQIQESLTSLTTDYFQMNPLLPIFTLMAPPTTKFIPQGRTLLPGCELRSQIRWFDYGTCVNGIIPVPGPVCSVGGLPFGLIFLTSSMVEYRWPAYKVDTSEQLYASLYYLKPLIESMVMPLNEIILEQMGNFLIAGTFNFIEKRREIEEGLIESNLMQAPPAATAATAQLDQNFFQELRKVDQKYRHSSGATNGSGHGYGRIIPETLNTMTVLPAPLHSSNRWRYLPHVPKYALVGADLPFSMFGLNGDSRMPFAVPLAGFPISKFYLLSSMWSQRFGTIITPFSEWRCLMNNKYDKKTPLDLFLAVGPNGGLPNANDPNQMRPIIMTAITPPTDDEMRLCVDKVGEAFTQFEHTRPHGTDMTFQSIWKASFNWRTFADILANQYQGGVEDPNNPARSDTPDDEFDGHAVGFHWEAFVGTVLSILNGESAPPAMAADNQGAWKAWRHLFRRHGNGADLYRFFQRKGEFFNETPQFMPLDKIVKGNWAYDKGGIKEAKSNFNQSAEVWPIFKGCFGKNLAKGGIPQKGDYPLFALPGISPMGYGPILSQSEDVMKLY